MLIIIFFTGTLVGIFLMGLMCASGQTHRCEECRIIPDKIERGSVTMICDAVIIHCDDYFDMMLKSAAIDNGSWEKFITNETKQGEWIIIGYDPLDMKFKCNKCGLKCNLATPYCPECGTKMKGADK